MGGLGRDRRGQRGDRTPTPRPRHPPGRFARRPERPACAVGIFQAPLTMRTPPPLALVLLALACVSEHGPLTNRMSQSTTSYLTRAARQPVSWQPWGREAFALAARLDRPVLLYVGADDCRWCVVMRSEEHTSELQSQSNLVCRLLLEKKKKTPRDGCEKPRYKLPSHPTVICNPSPPQCYQKETCLSRREGRTRRRAYSSAALATVCAS